jgi:hypothetical protein
MLPKSRIDVFIGFANSPIKLIGNKKIEGEPNPFM